MAEQSAGLMESLKRLVSTLTSIVSTRLELLANELQEERLRLTQMFLYSLFALFCFGMGMLLLTVFIVVLFWDDHRLAVTGCTVCPVLCAGYADGDITAQQGAVQTKTVFCQSGRIGEGQGTTGVLGHE